MRPLFWAFLFIAIGAIGGSGCVTAYQETIGADSARSFSKIYLTDFNLAWQAILESLKQNAMDVTNRDSGHIQTKWTDNTAEKNLIDSFGSADAYLKAQVRYKVTASKGFYNGKSSVKITIQKEQMIQRDVLEGWKPVQTDSVEEATLLYRIGRILTMKTKLARMEEQKTKHDIESSGFAPSSPWKSKATSEDDEDENESENEDEP
ncbi:hypothetical protein WDW86_19600 [Bdellovibrionota bacterium FG-2]